MTLIAYDSGDGRKDGRKFREVSNAMAKTPADKDAPITIKKYANRRLYNTAESSYVTLEHLAQMVKDGTDFVVYDAKTREDITHSVLTQIIVEEEGKGQNLLPISFLRQLISLYGDNLQWLVPNYLDYSMNAFARNQEQIRHYFQDTMAGMFPFGAFEEMGKQNVAMFEQAMKMFTPFSPEDEEQAAGHGEAPAKPAMPQDAKSIEELQRQLDVLQKQLRSMKSASKSGKD